MKKIIVKTLLIYFLVFINYSHSDKINSIQISGNKRIADETIILFSNTSLNNEITNDEQLNNIFKNIYKTNFFSEVKVKFKNNTLFIEVIENPIIQEIRFNGVKAKKTQKLIYDNLILKNKSSFVRHQVDKDILNISNSLKKSGYYFANVELEIEENNNNTVDLIYNINLGEKASIKKIKFLGNKIFKDRKLRNVIVSEEDRFWKFITGNIYVDEKRIDLDSRLLKNFYKNKGFYNVNVKSSFATYTGSNNFELLFTIDAGEKIYFNDFELILPDNYQKKPFNKVIKKFDKLKGELYSYREISKIIKIIEMISVDFQYDFLDANFTETIIDKNKLNTKIIVKESKNKFYIDNINIFGNSITEEVVLRNNLLISEGDALNELVYEKSINNLKSLNIFENVTSKITDTEDINKKNIEIEITEKATGEISAGAGVGTSGGTIGGGIKENNYLGKGIVLSANISLNEESIKGSFDYFNPNFKNSDKSLSLGLSSNVTDKLADFGYKSSDSRFHIGSGFQQYDDFYIKPSFSIAYDKVETSNTASANLKKQKGDYFTTNFGYEIDHDKRNQKFQPTAGFRQRFNQTIPLYSNELIFKNTYRLNKYFELNENLTSGISFYASTIAALDSEEDVRISKRLWVPNALLRGFEPGRIGPVDGDDFVGGNYASAISFNTDLPIFESWQEADIKYFYDAANVWGSDYKNDDHDSSKIRSATGLAIDWFTPVGPLTLSWAKAITKKDTDKTETIRFNIGTSF
tara:strand:+ start:426 stop:2675 length:2250 start_codon:yes stop_codon:yes gene_type:complete